MERILLEILLRAGMVSLRRMEVNSWELSGKWTWDKIVQLAAVNPVRNVVKVLFRKVRPCLVWMFAK